MWWNRYALDINMVPSFYPVVSVQPKWITAQEALGSKEKFWYRESPRKRANLFKYARKSSGEHWAEKVAAEVAGYLGISCARVELAEFEGNRGSATESFAYRKKVLFHGNQVMEDWVENYRADKGRGQSLHTLKNLSVALRQEFSPDECPQPKQANNALHQTMQGLANYLILDAVIGNTDRHHENWGLLMDEGRRFVRMRWAYWTDHAPSKELFWQRGESTLAPSFDHASSLGRELTDESRIRFLKEGHVGRYAEKGKGGVYLSETAPKGGSPLAVVRAGVGMEEWQYYFRRALYTIRAASFSSIETIVARVPENWMSPAARQFALALMWYNVGELLKIK